MQNLAPPSFKPEVRQPNHARRARIRNIPWPIAPEIEETEFIGHPIRRPVPVLNPSVVTLKVSDKALTFTVVGVAVKLVGASVSDRALFIVSGLVGGGSAFRVTAEVSDRARIGTHIAGGYLLATTNLATEDLISLLTESGNNLIVE